jgi:activating signal cointegrator 1
MKALSLTQPWATLVAIGAKCIETRTWHTFYTGTVAIHASKGFPRDARVRCGQPPFIEHLGGFD